MILLNDFKRQWEACSEDILGATHRVGASGWYILGKEVEQFESALANYWGLKHAVGVANGMDALEISLRCLGLMPGERVLTTPLTAFATTLAIVRAGGIPVFVDVDQLGQIDIEETARLLAENSGIRFVMPVHLFGFATIMPGLRNLAARFDVKIIEDCAQSIGASGAGRVGQMAATSFYPTKNLGALGDGGAVLTDDPDLAARARRLRNYGQSSQYVHDDLGLNSRLDELQAAILRDAFLPRLNEWTQRRRAIAGRYLNDIHSKHIQLLKPPPESGAVWHLFPVLAAPERRESFRGHLKQQGILSGVHYPTLAPDQAAMSGKGRYVVSGDLPNARRFAASEVSLPIHPYLTDGEIEKVVNACNGWPG